MPVVSFVLNLPWTIVGLFSAAISLPTSIRINRKPFAIVMNVKSFWWVAWIHSHRGIRAAASGNVVLLGNVQKSDLEHELIHVKQYMRQPFIHPFLYVLESMRHGYRDNKYELEAYRLAGNLYKD